MPVEADSITRLQFDHHLAVRPAFGQQADRLDALLQRQAMGYARPELALAVPAEQLVHRARRLSGAPAEIAQREPRAARCLTSTCRRDLRHAADEADQQDAAAPAETRQGWVEQRATTGSKQTSAPLPPVAP
jgi:uncharacterized protein (DUF3084 family)